jgi:folate-dependent phosphoribosylglycinamide formyltransferase PurN
MAERPSPVHAFAASQGIEVRTPVSLKSPEEQARFADLKPDAAVVVAYGLLLPKPILDAPRLGCFNVHASLLPRWRGAAPIQRAIMAGDAETGVTIMRMEEGLDTGPMCKAGRIAITPEATAQSLHDALAALGAQLMVEVLAQALVDLAVDLLSALEELPLHLELKVVSLVWVVLLVDLVLDRQVVHLLLIFLVVHFLVWALLLLGQAQVRMVWLPQRLQQQLEMKEILVEWRVLRGLTHLMEL